MSDVLRSPGHPLDAQTRTFFEPRLGHDFGHVRIHTDAQANASARAVQAHAYTVGRDVVFGGGRFSPRSRKGQRLLAHELTHVVQQTRRTSDSVSAARAVQEQEAERVSQDVMRGTHAPAQAPSASPIRVARQPVEAHEATDEDRRFVVDAAAQWLVGMAEQVQALRRAAAAALRTTPGSAAGPRAFHGYLNQEVLQRLMGKAISVFEAQRSDNPYINFPAESPEQTRLGEAYARALEQFGLAINEARANGANLAPTLRDAEESRYAANHLRWMEANPAAPLAAGMRTTFTRAEVDISTRRHSLVSTEFANLAANVHVYNLAGNGAQRLRQALADSAYRLVRDPTTSAVRAQPDTTLQATIQPVLDQLDAIDWAIAQAVDRLQRAETRTRAFAADPAANPADGNTLHAHFSTRHPGYATLLADRFARMQRELRGQGALTIHARNPSDPDCGVGSVGGGISVIAAHADANRFHFCGNVTIGDDEIVSTVIHETVHAVIPSLGARAALTPSSETPRDRSYAGERVYSRLTTEEALDNAESYAFYVDALFGVTVHRPTPPGDTVTGCSDPDTVRAALARATYRIRLAAQWASQYRASAPPPFVVTTIGV
ncbi:MAG: DUF4157 domain-containing protein, partial [Longimicrobiales bacterium]